MHSNTSVYNVGFNAGAHEATLSVTDCVIYGDVWSTRGRPGNLDINNLTNPRCVCLSGRSGLCFCLCVRICVYVRMYVTEPSIV